MEGDSRDIPLCPPWVFSGSEMETLGAFLQNKSVFTYDRGGKVALDLTYITPQILVAACTHTEDVTLVSEFLERTHGGLYRVYDLRKEDGSHRHGGGEEGGQPYRFWEHNVCPFSELVTLVEEMAAYLGSHGGHKVVIQCSGGRGRSGMVTACLLLRLGQCDNASLALEFFNALRTHCGQGVTIPSQVRWVHYYEVFWKRVGGNAAAPRAPHPNPNPILPPRTLSLRHIRFHGVPEVDGVRGGCTPYFDVRTGDGRQRVYVWRGGTPSSSPPRAMGLKHFRRGEGVCDFPLGGAGSGGVWCKGDVKLCFYLAHSLGAAKKLCHVWFNTGFVHNKTLVFHKGALDAVTWDIAHKVIPRNFALELAFDEVPSEVADQFDMMGDVFEVLGQEDEDKEP